MNRIIYGIYDRYVSKKVAFMVTGFVLISSFFEQSVVLVGTDPEGRKVVCGIAMIGVSLMVGFNAIGQGIADHGKSNLVPKEKEPEGTEATAQGADPPAQT